MPRQGGQVPARTGGTNGTGLYKVAFEESVRALEDQVKELDGIRQRLVSFLAFVGSATAFLVGSSLKPLEGTAANRDLWFYLLAIGGTVVVIIALGCAIYLLWPGSTELKVTASARLIISRTIEREVPAVESDGDLYRELAVHYDRGRCANDEVLDRVKKFYFWAIVGGVVQLGFWVALVWYFA